MQVCFNACNVMQRFNEPTKVVPELQVCAADTTSVYCCCSIKEPGLYDYVIFNDDLEDAFAQLVLVAKRALSGKTGNGSQSITGPVTLVAEEEPSKSAEASAAAAAPVAGASAQASRLEPTCMIAGHDLEPTSWHYALQPPAE